MPIRPQPLTALALAAALLAPLPLAAEPFAFIALGDMPDGRDQIGSLRSIGSKIRAHGAPSSFTTATSRPAAPAATRC